MQCLFKICMEDLKKVASVTRLVCHWAQDEQKKMRQEGTWLLSLLRRKFPGQIKDIVEEEALKSLEEMCVTFKMDKRTEEKGRVKEEGKKGGGKEEESEKKDSMAPPKSSNGDNVEMVERDKAVVDKENQKEKPKGQKEKKTDNEDTDVEMMEAWTERPDARAKNIAPLTRATHPTNLLPTHYQSTKTAEEYIRRRMYLFNLAYALNHSLLLQVIRIFPLIPPLGQRQVQVQVRLIARSLGQRSPLLRELIRRARNETAPLVETILEAVTEEEPPSNDLILCLSRNTQLGESQLSTLSLHLISSLPSEDVIEMVPQLLESFDPETEVNQSSQCLLSRIILHDILPASSLLRTILQAAQENIALHRQASIGRRKSDSYSMLHFFLIPPCLLMMRPFSPSHFHLYSHRVLTR